ncbi:hypothetical protein D3C84_1053430 [compost metagenome]
MIGDFQQHFVALHPGADAQHPFARANRLHGLAGVDDQIDDDLLQLHAIGADLPAERVQLDLWSDLVVGQFIANQAQGLTDDIVQRLVLAQRIALAR